LYDRVVIKLGVERNFGTSQTVINPFESNQKLILDFTFFHLEASNNCERDYVAIYTGNKFNKLVGKYCGRQAPPAIIFAADEPLRIAFHTDGEAGDDSPTGFALKFHKVRRYHFRKKFLNSSKKNNFCELVELGC